MKAPGFFFDQTLCTGCTACQIACKDKNDLPVGVTWRRVAEYTGGTWRPDATGHSYRQDVFTYYTSVACNHCDDPACVQACPSTAMHRGPDGIVRVDPDICIGCRYCEMACPYHAPAYDAASGRMTKCDFCADRLAVGGTPACVAACPSRALQFGEIEDLRRAHPGRGADIAPLPRSDLTRPHLVIEPHADARPAGSRDGALANPREV